MDGSLGSDIGAEGLLPARQPFGERQAEVVGTEKEERLR